MAPLIRLFAFLSAAVTLVSVGPADVTSELDPASLSDYRHLAPVVKKHGWACVYVRDDPATDSFAYTVGLSSKHLPELLFDHIEDEKVACSMLNTIAKIIVKRGTAHDGDETFSHDVRLRAIYPDEFFEKCLFAGVWRKEHRIAEARGMQVVLADKRGMFPP